MSSSQRGITIGSAATPASGATTITSNICDTPCHSDFNSRFDVERSLRRSHCSCSSCVGGAGVQSSRFNGLTRIRRYKVPRLLAFREPVRSCRANPLRVHDHFGARRSATTRDGASSHRLRTFRRHPSISSRGMPSLGGESWNRIVRKPIPAAVAMNREAGIHVRCSIESRVLRTRLTEAILGRARPNDLVKQGGSRLGRSRMASHAGA